MIDAAEEKLIEGLKAGRHSDFDAFLDLYGARLHRFALRMCRDGEDAKDVVQETLIAVFKSLRSYRGEGTFRAWVFRIVANACWKMRRKRKFDPEQELSLDQFKPTPRGSAQKPDIADWTQAPDELLLRGELRTVIERAIGELPRKYRIVLLLRDVEQLTTDETAKVLGLSAEAVKSRLHRARLFVRERLSGYLHAEGRAGRRQVREN